MKRGNHILYEEGGNKKNIHGRERRFGEPVEPARFALGEREKKTPVSHQGNSDQHSTRAEPIKIRETRSLRNSRRSGARMPLREKISPRKTAKKAEDASEKSRTRGRSRRKASKSSSPERSPKSSPACGIFPISPFQAEKKLIAVASGKYIMLVFHPEKKTANSKDTKGDRGNGDPDGKKSQACSPEEEERAIDPWRHHAKNGN